MRKLRFAAAAAVALLLLLGGACLAEAKNVAGSCAFWVSEGSARSLADNNMRTAWTPKGKRPEMRVQLPDGGAAYLQIEWGAPPTGYALTEYDAERNVLATHSAEDDSFACLSQLFALNEETRYVGVRLEQSPQGILEVRVFRGKKLPKTVAQWEPPHEKCDLMVISTHQDDEWLWFGGIIPYYDLVQDRKVQVVYMANCGRYRYGEALNGLAVSGVRTYPYFLNLTDKRDATLSAAIRTWESQDHILKVLVNTIRRFRPEVILTHDWDGEYGHPQHILTSRAMEYAIEAAADPEKYPASAEKYGAWQVKKLYRHLEKKGRIEFDWHVAYDEFGGRTGIQVAAESMNQHASQLKFFQVEDHGEYDNALFGLSYSVVGEDELHEDLFEHIEEALPEPSAEALPEEAFAAIDTPEPTAEPTPEPTPARTPDPTQVPTQAPTVEPPPEAERPASASPVLLAGGALALCGVAGIAVYAATAKARRRARRRKRRGKRR